MMALPCKLDCQQATVGELLTHSGFLRKRVRETFLDADDDALKSPAKNASSWFECHCANTFLWVTLKLLDAGIPKYKAVNWEDGVNAGQDKKIRDVLHDYFDYKTVLISPLFLRTLHPIECRLMSDYIVAYTFFFIVFWLQLYTGMDRMESN